MTLAAEPLELQLETYDRWLPQLYEHFVWLAEHCPDTNLQAKRNEDVRNDRCRLEGLGEAARAAFSDGKLELAAGYAMQALLHLPMTKKNWNTGNLIYDSHSTLGLIALRAGNLASAKRHLLAAGRTTGSPQLSSFGPDTELAAALLAAGERDTVIELLELCKQFWNPGSTIDEWQREIRDGEPSTMPSHRH